LKKEIHVNIEPYNTDNVEDWEKRNVYYRKPVATEKYIYAPCSSNEIHVWDWEGNPIVQYFIDIDFSAFAVSEELNKLYAVRFSALEIFPQRIFLQNHLHLGFAGLFCRVPLSIVYPARVELNTVRITVFRHIRYILHITFPENVKHTKKTEAESL
jgi:hypothetical protein